MDPFLLTVIGTIGVIVTLLISLFGLVQSYRRQMVNGNMNVALQLYDRVNADNALLRKENADLRVENITMQKQNDLLRQLLRESGININRIDISGSSNVGQASAGKDTTQDQR